LEVLKGGIDRASSTVQVDVSTFIFPEVEISSAVVVWASQAVRLPGCLWWNGYIPANRINSAGSS
jgi:hypothetical protein